MIAATVPMISGCSGRLITSSNGRMPMPSGARISARSGKARSRMPLWPAEEASAMSRHSKASHSKAQATPASRTKTGASSQELAAAENSRTGIMNSGGRARVFAPQVSLIMVSRPGAKPALS